MSYFTEYQIEHAYTPYIDVNTGYNNSIAYVNRNPGIPIFDIIDLYLKKFPFNLSGADIVLTATNSLTIGTAWSETIDGEVYNRIHQLLFNREGIIFNSYHPTNENGYCLTLDPEGYISLAPVRDQGAVRKVYQSRRARNTGYVAIGGTVGGGGRIMELTMYMTGNAPYTQDLSTLTYISPGNPNAYIPTAILNVLELYATGVVGSGKIGPIPYKDDTGVEVFYFNPNTKVMYCTRPAYVTLRFSVHDSDAGSYPAIDGGTL